MKKRSLLFLALALLMLLMLSGCGLIKTPKAISGLKETLPPTDAAEETAKADDGNDLSDLLSSLIAYDPMRSFFYTKPGESIDYHDLSVEKRMTDTAQRFDKVWVHFTAQTGSDLAEVYALMEYTLYNEGWLLDNVEILERKGKPLVEPDTLAAAQIMSERYDYYELCDEEYHSVDSPTGTSWYATKYFRALKNYDYLEECYEVKFSYMYLDTGRQGVGAPYWADPDISETLVDQNWGALLGQYEGIKDFNNISWMKYYEYSLDLKELTYLLDGSLHASGTYYIDEYSYKYGQPRLVKSSSSDFDITCERKSEKLYYNDIYFFVYLKDAGVRLYLSPQEGLGIDGGNDSLRGSITDSKWLNHRFYRFAVDFFDAPPQIDNAFFSSDGFQIEDGKLVAYNGCVSNVVIPESVTEIGDSAFIGCVGLTSVTIPDSVTYIGNLAFASCTALTYVTIPDSVTHIGNMAFLSCTALTDVTIPDGVTYIGDLAFWGCSSLKGIFIPRSVETIQDRAFAACSNLKQFSVAPGNRFFSELDGVLFSKDRTELIAYPCARTGSYTIPDGVTRIKAEAFSTCSLTRVTVPDGLTDIAAGAFGCSENLREIIAGAGNASFSSRDGVLFSKDGLELIAYPDGKSDSYAIPDGVTGIGTYAFACRNLTSLAMPDSITNISDAAFQVCLGLTDVYYSGSKAQWNSIIIGEDNYYLVTSNIHYNSEQH